VKLKQVNHLILRIKNATSHIGEGDNMIKQGDNMLATIEEKALTSIGSPTQEWVIDSGASHHMCNDVNAFKEMEELDIPIKIRVGNNDKIEASHIGMVAIPTKVKGRVSFANLQKVLYAPRISENLLSVSSCTSQGNKVIFKDDRVAIYNKNGDMIGSGNKNRGLYFLDRNVPQSQMFLAQGGDLKLWHCRLGHLNAQSLKILKNQNLVKGLENANLGIESKCEICAIGKMTKLPSKPVTDDDDQRGASKKLELIHSDVCGPVNITGYNGANYFVTFIDDYSRKSWIYTMKFKSEVLSRFKEFAEMVNNKGEEKIQMILSDNGGEYTSEDFKNYCKSKGIEQFHSSPYSPNQNGTAERYNRTIVEMTRCLLHESGLTLRLWPEALLTAAHIRNRSPHSSLENKITPEEAWSGQKPSINHLRKWGCKVSVLIPNQFQDNKFSSKVWWGSLVGFAGKQLGYRIWSSEKQRVFTRRDVRFFEDSHLDNTHSFVPPQQEKLQDNEEITVWFKSLSEQRKESEVAEIEAENDAENEPIQNQLEAEEESNQIMSPRRSTRERRPPERLTSSKLGEVKLAHGLIHSVDPQSYEEAMQSLERKEWEKAMKEEIQSLKKNNT